MASDFYCVSTLCIVHCASMESFIPIGKKNVLLVNCSTIFLVHFIIVFFFIYGKMTIYHFKVIGQYAILCNLVVKWYFGSQIEKFNGSLNETHKLASYPKTYHHITFIRIKKVDLKT